MIDFITTSYTNLYDKENIVLEICSHIDNLKNRGCEIIDINFIPLIETKELLTLYKVEIKEIEKYWRGV